MLLRPQLAYGQDARWEDGRWEDGRWNDGTWSGDDERSWDDGAPRGGEPRDGYAPRDRSFRRERYRDEEREERDREYRREEREGDEREEREHDDRDAVLYPRSGPSFVELRESLSPYGRWIETPEYGLVWRPADGGFRPYYAGRWAWTDAGWYWVADEPYGWAVYHYGRWALVGGLGWAWLPGRVWAPAWVSWRWGDGYAGWCPLGPRGYIYEQPSDYVMVPQQQFLAPVPHHAVPIVRAAKFFPQTHAMPIARPGPGAGPVVHTVAQAVGYPIRPLPIADTPAPPRSGAVAVSGGVLQAYRSRSEPFARTPASGGAGAGPVRAAPEAGGARWISPPAGPVRAAPAASPHRTEVAPRLNPAPQPVASLPQFAVRAAPPSAVPRAAPPSAVPRAAPPPATLPPAAVAPRPALARLKSTR